jgi:hypothetical protein
MVGVDPPRL